MVERDGLVDIPFLTDDGDGYEARLATPSFFDEDSGVPFNGPFTGALSLVGQQATVTETHNFLTVLFDIVEKDGTPLYVLFDIEIVPGSTPDPLAVKFDIIAENAAPLQVFFDIFSDSMITRRTSRDIQGPVAEVTIS
jgi:hypothetical protein